MMCPSCLCDRSYRDFLNKQTCYKCQYAAKIKVVSVKKSDKKCKKCGNDIPDKRWIYCSDLCANLAAKIQKKTEWTKLIH